MKYTYVLVITLLLLSGCENTSHFITKEECSSSNWKELGYKYANKGEDIRVFDKIKKTCGSIITEQVQDTFVDGYSDGLINYCNFKNGYELGKKGLNKKMICSLELRKDFMAGFTKGKVERAEILAKLERDKKHYERANQSKNVVKKN